MTIEEIEKALEAINWIGFNDSFAAKWCLEYGPKLLAVAKAAKVAWPRTMCDFLAQREHLDSCSACMLKKAVEELEK